MIPNLGGSIGIVMTFAGAGAVLRVGQNLDLGYGPPLIRPSLRGLAAVEKRAGFGWYVFAGFQGRAVVRDITLDENMFAERHSVDKKSLVGDALLGLAVTYASVRLAITQIYGTRELDRQRQPDRFGAISLSASF